MALPEHPAPVIQTHSLYADVIIPRHITKAFTYIVPHPLAQKIAVGRMVLVPFGRTIVEGAVISLSDQPPNGITSSHLKSIHCLADNADGTERDSSWLELSRIIAEQYVAPWGQCLRLVLPRRLKQRASSIRYRATEAGRTALDAGTCPDHLRGMLTRIARTHRGISLSTIRKSRDRHKWEAVEALERRSWIIATASADPRPNALVRSGEPLAHGAEPRVAPAPSLPLSPPSAEQTEGDSPWESRIIEYLRANQPKKLVLHAPWEYRINRLAGAIRHTLTSGKSAIVLSGEIAKAEWLGRFLSDIDEFPVSVLSPTAAPRPLGQRGEGSPSVIVGTRSAVFAPLRSIGLIWIDGEEDPAFKEPREPRYHAREVAWIRAEMERALLVLASAHPSLESMFDAVAELHTVLPDPTSRPIVELVDLNREPRGTLFSRRLVEAMNEALSSKAGVVLFLNRKGYARTLLCQDCGWIPRCSACVVPLAYSRESDRLVCRYCGRTDPFPQSCPTCKAVHWVTVGEGTERAEAEARRLFPAAVVLRLDGDRLRRPSAARDLWEKIRSNSWDILIGTQALFQHFPFPRRGLVGVLQADSGLHIPDFRAAERTYQLLDDAVWCAHPAAQGGRVILQTKLPAHHAIQAVLAGSPPRFYEEELAARRLLHFPPTCSLAALSVSGADPLETATAAAQWKAHLEKLGGAMLTILGPIPAMGRTPKRHARQQLLVKGTDRALLCRWVRDSLETMERDHQGRRITFIADIDPVDMG
ncbi:MAG: primosomal protein N' [Nitrospira sp.]|nr:primosomal protein N' [Nitrospira sp.]MCP9441839.1 primosomal protein N' [Nitrospira sp.]